MVWNEEGLTEQKRKKEKMNEWNGRKKEKISL